MALPSASHQSEADLIPTYTVCIVGDPRSGKSCFCNRFVCSHPDLYQERHASVLSEADFSGPVVNADHWLYWGTVTRRLVDESSVRFCVIEQTEFLSDITSQPFRSSSQTSHTGIKVVGGGGISLSSSSSIPSIVASSVGGGSLVTASSSNSASILLKELHSPNRFHDYILRSTAAKVYSPGKLRYYNNDQLTNAELYKDDVFPHIGPLEVHGFLVIYDVSRRAPSTPHEIPEQLAFLTDTLNLITKRKKPVVVVASKRDAVDEQCLSGVTQFLHKSADFRKIPVVEASAHKNINVDLAFLTLARLMENSATGGKTRSLKLKLPSYQEATREQEEHQRRLREAFVNRVSISPAGFLTDWQTFLSRYSHQGDVARFIDLWGSEVARETFEQFTAQWKTETKRRHMAKLPEALSSILLYVGPVTNQPPEKLLQRLRSHSQFQQCFVSDELSDESLVLHNARFSFQNDDPRIPFALALKAPPNNGDSPFMESIKSLVYAEAWAANMSTFEEALLHWQTNTAEDSLSSFLPGQSVDHKQLLMCDSATALSQEDRMEVYRKFQECLRLKTREEFLDLLLESLPLYIRAALEYLHCLGDSLYSLPPLAPYQSQQQPQPQARSEPNRSRPISPASEPPSIPLRSIQLPPADIRLCTSLAPPRGAKEQQLSQIRSQIASDRRYRAMDYMPSERQTYLISHLDILLHRPGQTEVMLASSRHPQQPQPMIQRHYSCSFVDQQPDAVPLTFPLPYCPAYQTNRCLDMIFENLCSSAGWSVGEAQNSFSSHLSSVLGQGDKRLRIAVCSICTDVVAATAGIGLFKTAGFVPEGVTSPSVLLNPNSVPRVSQNLVSSWPLASTLLTPMDQLMAAVKGNARISPFLGIVQASFLSHHELLTLTLKPRQSFEVQTPSSDLFDGVIILLSTDDEATALARLPPCTCGSSAGKTIAAHCCKCSRGAPDLSHTTHRPRSLASRVTAVQALVEHLAPLPHLFVVAGSSTDKLEPQWCFPSSSTASLAESSPKTPIARCSDGLGKTSPPAEWELGEESRPSFVLDDLSTFLSSCWTRKLEGFEGCGGGNYRWKSGVSPIKTKDSRDGSCSTLHEDPSSSNNNSLRPRIPSAGGVNSGVNGGGGRGNVRLHTYHRRCCRHHYHHTRRQHFRHPYHNHYRLHNHAHHHQQRCSSRTSANVLKSPLSGAATQLPKLTLIPALTGSTQRIVKPRSASLPVLATAMLTPPGRSSSLSIGKPGALCQPVSSVLDAAPGSHLDVDYGATVERLPVSPRASPQRLRLYSPTMGGYSSSSTSCSPCALAIISSSSVPSLPLPGVDSFFSTATESSSAHQLLLDFSEGSSPLAITADGVKLVDTTVRVVPEIRRRNCTRKGTNGKGEVFDTPVDALEPGMVYLVPCPHIEAPRSSSRSDLRQQTLISSVLVKPHSIGQKSIDLGLFTHCSTQPQQTQQQHQRQSQHMSSVGAGTSTTSTSTVTSSTSGGGGGGSVSSFLTSGIRAVTSGFARPRERRRSVSTPCGANEVLFSNNSNSGSGWSQTHKPDSSECGNHHHRTCYGIPGQRVCRRNACCYGGGYSTDTTSKASTPPVLFYESGSDVAFDGRGDSCGRGRSSARPRLYVASLAQVLRLAETQMTSKVVSQARHWHLPTCPHRLCIPRQNLPPPPPAPPPFSFSPVTALPRRQQTGSAPVEEHASFSVCQRSGWAGNLQTEVVAAQPPEWRHLPAYATDRSLPLTTTVTSLAHHHGHRRHLNALDLSSCHRQEVTDGPSRPAPPSLSMATTAVANKSGISSSTRRGKRNVLSLFSGRSGTTSSPVSDPGGGASFPSTPVHENVASTSGNSTTFVGHFKVKSSSPPPPLAPPPLKAVSPLSTSSSSSISNANSNS